jgi:bifunctional polynucleotide phosphatase/kinase
MSGPPGSGKSTFINKYLSNFTKISQDQLKTKAKCIKQCEIELKSSKNIVIDNTNGDKNIRKEYIDLGKKYGYKVKCINIICSKELARHNSLYRAVKTNWENYIPTVAYNVYYKKFTKPDKLEGFDTVFDYKFNLYTTDPDYFLYYY